jgi:AcrR family transcriptional regulator
MMGRYERSCYSLAMSKGDRTREMIVEEALRVASTMGLEGISIGELARRLELSKSGLFAHFQSKTRLQLEIVEAASFQFGQAVVLPALRAPRGEPRVQALFESWLRWANVDGLPGGCLFVSASAEFDDRPGEVRDLLRDKQEEWVGILERATRIARDEGHFGAHVDPEQFAFQAYAIMLGAHHFHRLLGRGDVLSRARRAFDDLLAAARG